MKIALTTVLLGFTGPWFHRQSHLQASAFVMHSPTTGLAARRQSILRGSLLKEDTETTTKTSLAKTTVVYPKKGPDVANQPKSEQDIDEEESFWDKVPLDVIGNRALDTAEDAFLHFQRKITDKPHAEDDRKTVVVLGSGWAAHALFKVADCEKLRVIVVSPVNHFAFTPLLASAATGTVECRSMTETVRSANPMIHEYIQGSATDLNVTEKKINVELNKLANDKDGNDEEVPTLELLYDHLIVSVGAQVHDFNIKGVKEHALKLKTIEDARRIRAAVAECFEHASSPDVLGSDAAEERTRRATILIAGGGPTGVELAGELSDLIKDVTARGRNSIYPNLKENTRVIIVEGGPTLVPPFNAQLRQEALRTLQEQGVEVRLNTLVTEVGEKSVKLSLQQFDEETGELLKDRKEVEVPVGLTVWAAGTKPQPFVGKLLEQLPEESRNRDGRVKVDRWMRPEMKDPALLGSVFVLGDASAHPCSEYSKTEYLPPTAQVAGQEGAFLARTLSRGYNMTNIPPSIMTSDLNPLVSSWIHVRGLSEAPKFHFLNLGVLAYVGNGGALTQIQLGEAPILSKAGMEGYLLCRSVYLAKQVAMRNRVLVLFDWIKVQVFGRDVTRFW